MKRTILASALLAAFAIPSLALATDGYFPHGYGMKAKGMGGASVAMADDSFGGANNPASMVWAGDRFDIGVDLFSPKRDISRSGSSGFGTGMDGAVTSGSNLFLIPEFGYNRMIGWDMSAGRQRLWQRRHEYRFQWRADWRWDGLQQYACWLQRSLGAARPLQHAVRFAASWA